MDEQAEFVEGLIAWVQALPVAWAYGLTVALLLALLALAWNVPRRRLSAEASTGRSHDLRFWITALIGIQLVVYLAFA